MRNLAGSQELEEQNGAPRKENLTKEQEAGIRKHQEHLWHQRLGLCDMDWEHIGRALTGYTLSDLSPRARRRLLKKQFGESARYMGLLGH